MDRVFLSWTFENWLTVTLMAFGSFLIFALASQLFRTVQNGG